MNKGPLCLQNEHFSVIKYLLGIFYLFIIQQVTLSRPQWGDGRKEKICTGTDLQCYYFLLSFHYIFVTFLILSFYVIVIFQKYL